MRVWAVISVGSVQRWPTCVRRFGACLFAALSLSPGWVMAGPYAACDGPLRGDVIHAAADGVALPAQAVWLDRRHVWWADGDGASGAQSDRAGASVRRQWRLIGSSQAQLRAEAGQAAQGVELALSLHPVDSTASTTGAAPKVPAYLGPGRLFALAQSSSAEMAADQRRTLARLLSMQALLVEESLDASGTARVAAVTRTQHPQLLDALYADAAERWADQHRLGAQPVPERQTDHAAHVLTPAPMLRNTEGHAETGRSLWRFALWAPTAQQVALCLYPSADAKAQAMLPLHRDPASGLWQLRTLARHGGYYRYLVTVWVPQLGIVRNLVTDPYADSLNANSQRAMLVDWRRLAQQPAAWREHRAPSIKAPTDQLIYELHVRDFSVADPTVPAAQRGKYLAFAQPDSLGMRHLRRLAAAGLTDVHLLPVFDFATVDEQACRTQARAGEPEVSSADDCYNWGYDPWHYNAPEGSYASRANDGLTRIIEFRQMVQGLHRAGLRVGMDVVYNHTTASGQKPQSVLDRIVPGYYQRLDRDGVVERSTCCDNTATEHRMMARLMSDSVLHWARHYRIDAFRFDLMGHQPRAAMQAIRERLQRELGPQRQVHLIGEGWDFGEVAGGARFVQASQLSLHGAGIGTFNDRLRDAYRGGTAMDGPELVPHRLGWGSGLVQAVAEASGRVAAPAVPKAETQAEASAPTPTPTPTPTPRLRDELLHAADLIRAGLAGSLRELPMTMADGRLQPLHALRYAGSQPAAYAAHPSEVVNYVENHDNLTLWDSLALKQAQRPAAERARLQHLGSALVAFSQGIAYFHAGQEMLRSKGGVRDSYDAGDAVNQLRWRDDAVGAVVLAGHPDAQRVSLGTPLGGATPADRAWATQAFTELLQIRRSSGLFRLRSADEVTQHLRFLNVGPTQNPAVIALHLHARGPQGQTRADAGFDDLVVLLNADDQPHAITEPGLAGRPLRLHPVLAAVDAADASRWEQPGLKPQFDPSTGRFEVPPLTAVVWVGAPLGPVTSPSRTVLPKGGP